MMCTTVACMVLVAAAPAAPAAPAWTRVGPWNIFDALDAEGNPAGEAGTLNTAASPKANPSLIYAGGQNNGVSSGILKTLDGGKHWTRQSKGLWDTRILGVWIHPDDPQGSHVFTGTHSGIYESKDAAESWTFANETAGWYVKSFRQGVIDGESYIFANGNGGDGGFIASRPLKGGAWQKATAPGYVNGDLSLATVGGKTELMSCIGGSVYIGAIDSPTNISWQGPMKWPLEHQATWTFAANDSAMSGMCASPTQCNANVHDLGVFDTEQECRVAVNSTHSKNATMVASWTYQQKNSPLGPYAGHCYVLEDSAGWTVNPQEFVDSGRAPGTYGGGVIPCSTVWMDPNDNQHFLFAKDEQFKVYESKDGGKSITIFENQPTSAYYVSIDTKGLLYAAGGDGAFVSKDQGQSWHPYHVVMHVRPSDNVGQRVIDRVVHDFQNIIPDFRDDGVAFPSDQGLHIVDRSSDNYTLISAVGDMHNNMAISVLISPSKDGKSRNLVTNLWDWDVVASWDDGATWAGWNATEQTPEACNEGGYGKGLGASPYQIMFHNENWWASADGGHNFKTGNLPGGGSVFGDFDYVRTAGSRYQPEGTIFALMGVDSVDSGAPWTSSQAVAKDKGQQRMAAYDPRQEKKKKKKKKKKWNDKKKQVPKFGGPGYQLAEKNAGAKEPRDTWLMTSRNFGVNFNFTKLPAKLQGVLGLYHDPTSAKSLYAVAADCLSHSTDDGKLWSPCMKVPTSAALNSLIIKDSLIMFLFLVGAPPLRTTDGGGSWRALNKLAPLFPNDSVTFGGALSWTGKTLVMYGNDLSAIDRQEFGTIVWKSTNDGETWSDETDDIVTISPGAGVWYDKDFYFVTRGEGVCVKRNFE